MKRNCVNKQLVIIGILVLMAGCKTPVQEKEPVSSSSYEKSLLNANRYIQERNREQIMAFSRRAGWEMKETPTGLWYMIIEEGAGRKVKQDDVVTYSYEIKLLDGTYCYSADTINPKKIVIGKGGVEAGIEEGLLLLKANSKARLIVPPYLAHGNFGDRDKIPGAAILIVELNLIDIQ